MSLPEKEIQAQKAAIEYAGARAKIEQDRLKAWSSAPGFRIGSFTVYPLSLRSMVDLELAGNAFFTGSQILHGDIAAYIWRHLPEYDRTDSRYEKNCQIFLKKIADAPDAPVFVADIKKHIEMAFLDDLISQNLEKQNNDDSTPPITGIVALCHEYGAAYGINPVEVAEIDLRIVFQCCRAIRMSQGDVKFPEPKPTRDAIFKYLKAKNG